MPRPLSLVPVLAIAALLVAAPCSLSAPAAPTAELASIEIDLPASNGFSAHLQTLNEEVELDIRRPSETEYVSYEVDGEPTEAGLKVSFGKLGRIDTVFEPTETRMEALPKGCTGKPSTFSEGFFVGTIEFTGEREYVRIKAARVEGSLSVYRESDWKCKGGGREGARVRRPPADGLGRSQLETGPASLVASSSNAFFFAYAPRNGKGRGRSAFAGVKFEEREGMTILRGTGASAGKRAFVFDHAAGTARMDPPKPLSGNAFFKRRPGRRGLWRGKIEVPILGADPITVRRQGFRFGLAREFPFGD